MNILATNDLSRTHFRHNNENVNVIDHRINDTPQAITSPTVLLISK